MAKQQYKRLTRIYGKDAWLRTVTFTDDSVIVAEEINKTRFRYTDVMDITEKGNDIRLVLRAKTVIRMYRSKFVDCTWEECKAKLMEKNPGLGRR